MQHSTKIITTLLIILVCSSFVRPVYGVEDAIVAIVNDEIITLKDLRDYIKGAYVSLVAEGRPDSEIEKIMLDLEINGINKLIEDKLILSKSKEMGLIVRDKLIENRIEEIKDRYPSEQVFLEALISHGASLTDLREKILDQLKIKFAIEHAVKSKIYVNPQEVTQYYQDHLDQFQQKEEIEVESIFIPYEDNKKAGIKKAHVALELIRNGENFSGVAADYSKLPSLGRIERGTLQDEIEKEIFHLAEGVASNVIETDNGAYIFQITQKYPAQLAPLNDVRDDINHHLYNKKYKERIAKWLAKLKQDAYIDIKE